MVEVAIDAVAGRPNATGEQLEKPASGSEKRRVLPALRDVTLVATIYLFFAGFVFRYFYFRLLGISPSEIELSLNALLVLAFNVFLNVVWLPVAVVAALAVLSVPKVRALVDVAFVPLLALVVIGGFYVLYFGARDTAARVAGIVRDGYGLPPLALKLRDGTRYDRDFLAAVSDAGNTGLKAYLVEQNASTYFVLLKRVPPDAARPDRLYAVPKADVLFVSESLQPPAR